MKKLTMILILLIITSASAPAGVVETLNRRYYADYTIYASIKPLMSNDRLSVLSWQSVIKVKSYAGRTWKTYMRLWTNSETNIRNFDLTEPADRTVSEFITSAATWLEAQQDMFVNAYLVAQKINRPSIYILPEIVFSAIDFTNNDNVTLIDTTAGALPTGEIVASPYYWQ
jgi:hypothetical protein